MSKCHSMCVCKCDTIACSCRVTYKNVPDSPPATGKEKPKR